MESDTTRLGGSIMIGALVGAVVTNLYGWLSAILEHESLGHLTPAGVVFGGTVVFFLVWLVWFVGLVIFATGPWLMLHRRGHRSWWVFVLQGIVTTFVVTLALVSLMDAHPLPGNEFLRLAKIAGMNAAVGAIVALTTWWTAYKWRWKM